ncbi:MAG: hypothetical protein M5U26_30595 [Planctomycetota bacterium]|nr:hypothetical protein [Planctomycetota bacterium]
MPDDAPKYRYPKGLKLDAPAYLRAVDRRKAVVVVEGFLDAALAHALAGGEAAGSAPPGTQPPEPSPRLLGQLVATGTNRLNRAQLEALQRAGVRELVLCFDADDPDPARGAGARGTLETLDRLAEAGTFFPRVLRLPAELGCKDPDELLTRHGAEVFEGLFETHTRSEAEFRAEVLLGLGTAHHRGTEDAEGHRGESGNGTAAAVSPLPSREGAGGGPEQENSLSPGVRPPASGPRIEAVLAALAEALEREAARPARALFVAELTRLVAAGLGLDEAALAARLEPFRALAAQRRRAELLQRAALEVQTGLGGSTREAAPGEEALARAESALREGLERAAALRADAGLKDVLAPVSLGGYRAAVLERPDFLETPYRKLDEAAAIHPGRITLVAARPSHGKTTFLLNLLVHWLKVYPERRFVYFSYDGPREQLLSQLVSRVTRRYALREVEDALRGDVDPGSHPEAEELAERTRAALAWLEAQGLERRLFIVDRALSAGELGRAAKAIAAGGPLGAIMVDYIQQVRPDRGAGKALDSRQREVGYVSRTLQALAQELGVPVVAAAQLNRVSESTGKTDRPRLWQLREAGDLEQDATTVYGLYNHHQAAAEAQPFDDGAPATMGLSAWSGGPVLGLKTNGNGNGHARKNPRRKRTETEALMDALNPQVDTAVLAAAGRWTAPGALRSVALDVEVLKARHGRTHARVALTYDLIANHITDGRSDGEGELQ